MPNLRGTVALGLGGFVSGYCALSWYEWRSFFAGAYDDVFTQGDKRDILKCWYAKGLREPHAVRPPLAEGLDEPFDVAVIGGGAAGLHLAVSLGERKQRVAVIEARRIASGASGRNGGQLLAAYECDTDDIVWHGGADTARTLFQASVTDGTERTVRLINEHDIDCELERANVLAVSFPKAAAAEGLTIAEAVQDEQAVCDEWYDAWGEKWVALDTAGLAANGLRSPRFSHGTLSVDGAAVNPLSLMFGLARVAEGLGARLFEYSPVTRVVRHDGLFKVSSPNGSLKAKHVILATGSAPAQLAPHLAVCTTPATTALLATEPMPKDLVAQAMDKGTIVFDDRFHMNYFRRVGDDRMLFGGMGSGRPLGYTEIKDELLAEFGRVFPSLKPYVKVDSLWQGAMHMRHPSGPLVGHDGATGMWYALSFGGHGLAATAAVAEQLARAIVENDKQYQLWSKFNWFSASKWQQALSKWVPPSVPLGSSITGPLGVDIACAYLTALDWKSGRWD